MANTSKNFLRRIVDPADANLDIVAVHGLNPSGNEIHAEDTWSSGNKLWLRDFLPDRLPKARILLFGYNSNVAFETSTTGVREQGENLLIRLKIKRREAPNRPIIFICHSLGGIVVKRALMSAKHDDTHQAIRLATKGIAFFATPHRGGNGAKLGEIAAGIARIALRNPKTSFLEALKKDSLFAEELVADFRYQLEDYYILSFIETLRYKKIGLIVDKQSATLGLAGSREMRIEMEADHAQICKFESADDDRYELVVESLIDLADRATNEYNRYPEALDATIPLHQRLPDNVSKYDMPFSIPVQEAEPYVTRHEEMKILQDHLLPNQGSEKRRIFVVHGLGGSGKTQLAAKFARLHRKDYSAILWVEGSTCEAIKQSFIKLAPKIPYQHIQQLVKEGSKIQIDSELGRPKTRPEDLISAVLDWLALDANRNWLLLLNNVDRPVPSETDPHAYNVRQYIPDGEHGSVIITTRYFPLCEPGMSQTLTRMTEDEALQVLVKGSGHNWNDVPKEAKVLASELGCLPLALKQASSYIKQNALSLSQYLDLYKTDWLLAMGEDSFMPYTDDCVAKTWLVSYRQIKQQHPLSVDLLHVLAYLQGTDISYEIFKVDLKAAPEENLRTWRNPPELVEKLYTPRSFQQMMRPLLAYSLLYPRSGEHDGYEMHPVVQDWCLSASTQEERDKYSVLALRILGSSSKRACDKEWTPEVSDFRGRLVLHASRCLSLLNNDIETKTSDLREAICIQLFNLGLLSKFQLDKERAAHLLHRSFIGFTRIHDLFHRWTRKCALILLHSLVDCEKFEEADDTAQQVLSGFNTVPGDEYQRLEFVLCSAIISGKRGKSELATTLFHEVMQSRQTQGAAPQIKSVRGTLYFANFCAEQERFEEAIEKLLEILNSDKHWDSSVKWLRFKAFRDLLAVYRKLRRFKEAVPVIEAFLSDFEAAYGTEDPQTFEIIRILGFAYIDADQLNKARQMFCKTATNPGPKYLWNSMMQ